MTEIHRIKVPLPIPVGYVNCYYIRDSLPTLIDTGINTDDDFDAISSALTGLGDSVTDLRRVVATHGHGDHVGLAGRLARVSGAEVFLHPWDKPRWPFKDPVPRDETLRKFREFFESGGVPGPLATELVGMMQTRQEGMFAELDGFTSLDGPRTFPFDDFDLEVVQTPGHSPGSVCLFNRSDGTLFAGDALLEEITFNPAREAEIPDTYYSLAAYLATLDVLEALPVQTVFPGHGAAFTDIRKRLEGFRDFHRIRREKVLASVEHERHFNPDWPGLTQFQIMKRVFPDATGLELFYRLCAVHVHLERLVQEGPVTRSDFDSPSVFHGSARSIE